MRYLEAFYCGMVDEARCVVVEHVRVHFTRSRFGVLPLLRAVINLTDLGRAGSYPRHYHRLAGVVSLCYVDLRSPKIHYQMRAWTTVENFVH